MRHTSKLRDKELLISVSKINHYTIVMKQKSVIHCPRIHWYFHHIMITAFLVSVLEIPYKLGRVSSLWLPLVSGGDKGYWQRWCSCHLLCTCSSTDWPHYVCTSGSRPSSSSSACPTNRSRKKSLRCLRKLEGSSYNFDQIKYWF